ncbi:MAG: PQQ-dependent dehydrogenase, methanol/ethanol family [Gemmatimonadales bacterium]
MIRARRRATGLAVALALAVAFSDVSAQRRPQPPPAPAGGWTSPAGDPALTRHSPLDQINATNVSGLRPVWSFSTGSLRGHEGSPLVVGATMFVHTPWPNAVFALDLRSPGAPIKWRYPQPEPRPARRGATPAPPPTGCCDAGSRGLAWHQSGKLYVPLLNGELAALDAETGREIWRVRNGDPAAGAIVSGAPLVVRDLVLIGVAGAGYGVRGHLSAYDANTGRLVWRGYSTGPDADVLLSGSANPQYPSHSGADLGVSTWPGDAWRTGGGTTPGWLAYDPELDLVFYGTDEPAPANPAQRAGDNKWTSSLFAREAATGRVRWIYQLTPHDEWRYGASNESILADLTLGGSRVPSLVHFDRNGFAYVLERSTGKVRIAERWSTANWAGRIDLSSGLPDRDPRFAAPAPAAPAPGSATRTARPAAPRVAGICPASIGAKHLQPAAYSPVTGFFFVPGQNFCMDLTTAGATFTAGQPFSGATVRATPGPGGSRGRVIGWDAATATVIWEVKEDLPVAGGVLATAGGLVFYGTLDGWLKALDQKTGRELWKHKTPSGIIGSPMAFLDPEGRQHIAVLSGVGGWWGQGADGGLPDLAKLTNPGGVLTVFGL